MSDLADFRDGDIEAIWGTPRRCVLTGIWQFCDGQHIMGRGGEHNREVHSSIFNFIGLNRDIHKGGYRDHPLMRVLFLNIASAKILEAATSGIYEITDSDRDFLKMYDAYYDFHWDSLPRIA